MFLAAYDSLFTIYKIKIVNDTTKKGYETEDWRFYIYRTAHQVKYFV